jgi:hypothetical protein
VHFALFPNLQISVEMPAYFLLNNLDALNFFILTSHEQLVVFLFYVLVEETHENQEEGFARISMLL